MGLEATWSLVDIPANARDAAQAAARREGLSVGEWLTRRILKRFSELNVREQEDAFVTLRNHVAELADRLDHFESHARAEPMREALKKLHQGLTRLNEELVRTAGHSAIQISHLSTSLEVLNERVDEFHGHDTESRGAFERRMAQLQEFVEGMNLRHSAETRAIASRMDSLGGTLAESRRLIASESNAIERLEDSLAKADTRYGGAFRAFHEKFDSVSEKLERAGTAASESSADFDQRIASLQLELGNLAARHGEEKQLVTGRLEKLHGKIDDLQADVTGTCGALDRRVLVAQQALQSLDARHAEMSHSLTRGVESVAAQMETVRCESVQGAASLESRIANLEAGAKNVTDVAANNRLVAVEHQLADLADRTRAVESTSVALLPKTEAIESQLEDVSRRLESEVEKGHQAVEQLKVGLIDQTLNALGEKLEAESRKQQAAIAELTNGLLGQLSQAFDERADAEERKQQDAMAQLQSTFATALRALGETFEAEARKQQDAIAELKASLVTAPQQTPAAPLIEESDAAHAGVMFVENTHVDARIDVANMPEAQTPLAHADDSAAWMALHNEEPVLELTTLADHAVAQIPGTDEQTKALPEAAAVEPPPFATPDQREHPAIETPVLAGLEQLSPASMMARSDADKDLVPSPSYLSAARQSLQAAAVRNETEPTGSDLLGFRFLKSLPLAGKQKGQATSYALMAGIALVAVLAIVVGAVELMNRSAPSPTTHLPSHNVSPMNWMRVTQRSAAKRSVSRTIASAVIIHDRTTALANGGDARAQLLLGLRDLAKNNNPEAAKWLERAATQGVPVAQYRLGTIYASGRGVPADKIKAFHWYLAAAQAGNRKAMSNLAVAYAEGDGTPKNPQEAGRWFLKAAQLGLADAQFDLAILYERGLGVPQNLTDAYRWYVIAAKVGDKESKDRVDALASQLTGEDRAAAETAAAEFKPLPMNARANEPQ